MVNPLVVALALGASVGALLYVILFQNPLPQIEAPYPERRRRRRDPLEFEAPFPE